MTHSHKLKKGIICIRKHRVSSMRFGKDSLEQRLGSPFWPVDPQCPGNRVLDVLDVLFGNQHRKKAVESLSHR